MVKLTLIVLLMMVATVGWSAPPETISFQGALRDSVGSLVPDGDYNVTFRIYDVSSGGSALWTEEQTATVSGSVFSTILGQTIALDLAFDKPYWLGIQMGIDQELEPRVALTAAPYSLNVVDGRVIKSLNGLTDQVTVTGGANITVSEAGNTIIIDHVSAGSSDASIAYPDGLASMIPITESISSGTPYTVPAGRNLYITNIYNPAGDVLKIGPYDIMDFQGNASTKLPIIAATGQIISTNGAMTVNGFLVDAVVTPVTVDVTSGGAYVVPAGRTLVITNVFTNRDQAIWQLRIAGVIVLDLNYSGQTFYLDQPLIAGEGQPVEVGAPYTHAGVINGYLR